MAAVNLNQTITDKVVGDDLRVVRTYADLPSGFTIAKAWMTVKARKIDIDAAALIGPKEITTAANAHGQITDDGTAVDGEIAMYFDLSSAETGSLSANHCYFYDIQIKTSAGAIFTCELGTMTFRSQITQAIA